MAFATTEAVAGIKRGDRVEIDDRSTKLWQDGYRSGTVNMLGPDMICVRFDKDGKTKGPLHPSKLVKVPA